jgi:DNA-binding NarL/FixJ family response regulator
MDVGMPELDGLEATRRICEQDKTVEVLIFTQHSSREARELALQAGARGYLPKSQAVDLLEALETIADHKNYSGQTTELASD